MEPAFPREALAGDIARDFNFSQNPRSPLMLNPCPATTLTPKPAAGRMGTVALHFDTWGDT